MVEEKSTSTKAIASSSEVGLQTGESKNLKKKETTIDKVSVLVAICRGIIRLIAQ